MRLISKAKIGLIPVKREVVNTKTGKPYMITLYVKPAEANKKIGIESKQPDGMQVEKTVEKKSFGGMTKDIKQKLVDLFNYDADDPPSERPISFHSDGNFTIRTSYFYRHGKTAQSFGDSVLKELQNNGIGAELVDVNDKWRAWPKTSFFEAKFRIKGQ